METLIWILTAIGLGAGLAMDACAVSMSNGLAEPKMKLGKIFTSVGNVSYYFLCFFPSVTKTRIITRAMKSKYSMLRYITKYQHY